METVVILIVKFMSQLKLDHLGKPERTGGSFPPDMGLQDGLASIDS